MDLIFHQNSPRDEEYVQISVGDHKLVQTPGENTQGRQESLQLK